MIRINCDICGNNIPQGEVAQMTLRKPNKQALQMELCKECLKIFDNFTAETKQMVRSGEIVRNGEIENPL